MGPFLHILKVILGKALLAPGKFLFGKRGVNKVSVKRGDSDFSLQEGSNGTVPHRSPLCPRMTHVRLAHFYIFQLSAHSSSPERDRYCASVVLTGTQVGWLNIFRLGEAYYHFPIHLNRSLSLLGSPREDRPGLPSNQECCEK